ncbi:MAG: hypothetical protein F6J87_16155 [Spirulina sp. SIO3F2]|nr:hypothetical protein [Spirulina sp. SIO3F2]
MTVKPSHYETLLAEYSNRDAAIALLRQHRPYLEMLPSLRRPYESLITLPLPVVRLRLPQSEGSLTARLTQTLTLPCDLAFLMCDPEWKIKMGVEILVFIYRPGEDFSDLLLRWRHSQVHLDQDYEWLLPHRYEHLIAEGSEQIHPLFVVFPETPERIQRGLAGASLPYVVRQPPQVNEEIAQWELASDGEDLGIEGLGS